MESSVDDTAPRSGQAERGEPEHTEAERLQALRRYQILDTPPEEVFDRITRLAAGYFDVPIALISFVEAERQWPKSCYGIDRREIDRAFSFCHYAIQSEAPLVIEDAPADPRFATNPLVTGDVRMRFYAGAPLLTPGGHRIGALCVLDSKPRSLSEEGTARLQDLAAMAMDALEQRHRAVTSARDNAAQRKEQEFTEALIDGLPGIFYLFDKAGRMKQWNEHFEEATGRPPEEICAMKPPDFVRPDERGQAPERMAEAFEAGETSVKLHLMHKDGTSTPYLCYGRRLMLDGQPHLVGMGIDITQQKEAERALRESEKRHRVLVERASDIITIFEPDGSIRYISPPAERILGYPPADLEGRSAFPRIHPDDRAHMRSALQTLLEEPERVVTRQFRTRHANGSWVHLESVGRNLLDDPAIEGLVVNSRDITDNLRFEAEREARKRAEELLEAKTSFLNNVSHELRTPLASILGFAELLVEEGEGVQQEFAGHITSSGERLQTTLDSILSLAQLNSQEAELNLQPVDVTEAVRETAKLLRPAAEEKSLTFEVVGPKEGDVHASLDEAALHRILDNLMGNAIKFTDEGRVVVTVEPDAHEARIRVEDTGIGIREDFQERLFEDFQQESTGLGRDHEGAGLGLAITRRLIELMDGTIEVESTKGEGSVFTVRFPRVAPAHASDGEEAPRSEAAAPPGAMPTPATASTAQLLVVEDNPNTRALAHHLLRPPRYQVAYAAGVEEALTQIREQSFDALLIDINLGASEDGVGLLHRLRALPAISASVPAIAFTAHAMPGDEERLLDAGFDDYLSKPFSERELLETIEAALRTTGERRG